jgi:uncharacterized protein (TIGR02118 family)
MDGWPRGANNQIEETRKMVKLMVLYNRPLDEAEFESDYFGTHVGLARRIPGLLKLETARVVVNPEGGELPYYRIAELWFDDQDALLAGVGSPEGAAAVADLGNFATGEVTQFVSAVD